jgi:hypothetical protein
MNIETNCCENMLLTCFASCLEMWNVIWEMRLRFGFCLKLFETIHFRDYAWSFHRQFFWLFNLIFDEWRMLILDYRVTYVCSRFVEQRMFIFDLLSDVYDETSLNLTRFFIKLIVSDSSNLINEKGNRYTYTLSLYTYILFFIHVHSTFYIRTLYFLYTYILVY